MTTSYPGAIDSLTNPTTSDNLNSPSHAGQHANANDAIEAIEATLGTDPFGWAPAAFPIGGSYQDAYSTGINLSAVSAGNGGTVLIPIRVVGKMQLHSCIIYSSDTASARSGEWRLYKDDQTGTLAEVVNANGTWSFTPSAASSRESTCSTSPTLEEGIYWLAIRNTSTSQTFGVGVTASVTIHAALNNRQKSDAALGSTLSVSGYSTLTSRVALVMLKGRVFGESSGY